jgi:hypothetical protein
MIKVAQIVGDRLKIIQEINRGELKKLLVMESAFKRNNSTVFNGLYYQGVVGLEVFIEISGRVEGCKAVNDVFPQLQDFDFFPHYYFSIRKIIGIVYEKIVNSVPFEYYFYYHCERIGDFFFAVEEMIEQIHRRYALLPPGWDNQGLLFTTKGRPVLIGYPLPRINKTERDFLFGCRVDWSSFLCFIKNWKNKISSDSQEIIVSRLEGDIKKKIGITAVA